MRKYLKIGLLSFLLALSAIGMSVLISQSKPILEPTVHGKTYKTIDSAVVATVSGRNPEDVKLDDGTARLIVFYKNDCKYCRGGIGGVLEAYQELSLEDQGQVTFHSLDTEEGLALAKSLGATTTSQMAVVEKNKSVRTLFNYATEQQRSNKREISEALELLREWRSDDE